MGAQNPCSKDKAPVPATPTHYSLHYCDAPKPEDHERILSDVEIVEYNNLGGLFVEFFF
jgi:hypothetical protein